MAFLRRQPTQVVPLSPYWRSRGLVGAFTSIGGRLVDLCHPELRPTADTSTIRAAQNGVQAKHSGTSVTSFPHHADYAITGALSIFADIDVDSFSNYGHIIGKQQSAVDKVAYEFRIGLGPSDNAPLLLRGDGAYSQWYGSSGTTTTGRRTFGVTHDAGAATAQIYVDGIAVSTTADAARSGADNGTSELRIARRVDGSTQMDGGVGIILLFNKVLTAAEFASLHANPWQVLYEADEEDEVRTDLWTPSNLSTAPVAWFDAYHGVTHSGGGVSSWASRVGSVSVTQATGSDQPTYSGNGWGSKPAITFGGSDRLTGTVGTAFGSVCTMVAVWRPVTGDTRIVAFAGITSGDAGYGLGWNHTSGGYFNAFVWGSGESQLASTVEPIVQIGSLGGGSVNGTFNGSAGSTGSSTPSLGTSITIGSDASAIFTNAGPVCEVLFFDYVLSSTEIEKLTGYLAWKWRDTTSADTDLVAQLPSGHTYKSAAPTTSGGGGGDITATASLTTADATLTATGTVDVAASASITTADATLSGTATVDVVATAGLTTADATLTATGAVEVAGQASLTTDNATGAGTGAAEVAGTETSTTDDATLTATGTVDVAATAGLTTDDATLAGTGTVDVVATATLTTDDATLAGTGTVGDVISSTASLTTDDATLAASATVEVAAQAALTTEGATLAATATVDVTASATLTTADATLTGTGHQGEEPQPSYATPVNDGGGPDDEDFEPAGPHAVPEHLRPKKKKPAPEAAKAAPAEAPAAPAIAKPLPAPTPAPMAPTPAVLEQAAREETERALRLVMLIAAELDD